MKLFLALPFILCCAVVLGVMAALFWDFCKSQNRK